MVSVPWHELEGVAAEKFISIMLLREFPDGTRRRATQGDGGIDVIVPVSDQPRWYDVYQIKYYYQALDSSKRSKIKKSAARLLETVRERGLPVRTWHLTLPIDPSASDEEWIQGFFGATDVPVGACS